MTNNNCFEDNCDSVLCVKTYEVKSRRIRHCGQYCAQHAETFWSDYKSAGIVGPRDCTQSINRNYDIELLVIDYRTEYPCWISLKESGGNTKFNLQAGVFEVTALLRELEDVQRERPLTHNLVVSVAAAFRASFDLLTIDHSGGSKYYSGMLRLSNKLAPIDCRPSDGIVLAVISGSPIQLTERLHLQLGEVP